MSRKNIDTSKTYWAHFNRFEIQMPGQAVVDCSASGSVDDAVAYWAPRISSELSAEDIRAELQEYGAWDDAELADNDLNWERLVWIAAGNIAEEESPESVD